METTLQGTAVGPITGATFLRRALLLDAVASGTMGAAMAVAAAPLADWFGLPPGLLRWAGIGLIPFAALLAYLGSRQPISPLATQPVVIGNLVWTAGSLLILIAGWVAPTTFGVAFVLAQAVAVALFAGLQELGLRRAVAAAP